MSRFAHVNPTESTEFINQEQAKNSGKHPITRAKQKTLANVSYCKTLENVSSITSTQEESHLTFCTEWKHFNFDNVLTIDESVF